MIGVEDQSIVLRKNKFHGNFIDVDNDELKKIKITKLPTHVNIKLSNNLITTNLDI